MRRRESRTYRRIKSERPDWTPNGCTAVLATDPGHEARIRAHAARVQAELVHHPADTPVKEMRQRMTADRRAVADYLRGQGGSAPRRWIGLELGWDSPRIQTALRFPAWFVRDRGRVRLTPAGWAASKEECHAH